MKSRDKAKFLFSSNLSCTLILFFSAHHAQAFTSLDLGTASTFNGFVLGNMVASNSDIEGRLAVGGNLSLNNYSIGKELADSNGARDDLIAGGTMNFNDGRVYNGNARSGGIASIDQVGFYNDNDITTINGGYIPGNPLNFTGIGEELRQKSLTWSGISSTGTTLTEYNNIKLTGTDAGLNVFSLNGADLSNAGSLWLDIPNDSWALVNISGSIIDMHDFGFFRTINGSEQQLPDYQLGVRHDGSLTQKVLFNLFDADTLNLYAIGIKGSILAPGANTIFYNGHIDGNLIVASLGSKEGQDSGEIHLYPFITNGAQPAPVPIPSMLIPVLILLGIFFKQQISRKNRHFVTG